MAKTQRKFTPDEVMEIRKMRKDTPIAMIATCFNASVSTIHDIVRGRTYKEVGGKTYARKHGHRVVWATPRKRLARRLSSISYS